MIKPSRLFGQDVLSISELDIEDIQQILSFAKLLKEKPQPQLLDKRLIAHCFFEPSTRTKLSFNAATFRCGGEVFGFDDANSTSSQKGESLTDTMRIMDGFADLIILRHPKEGAARLAAEVCACPVINAGDGANQHPTQTLLDLYSIQESQNRLHDLHLAFMGDLKYGRTAHSLAEACALFNMRLYFVAPEQLSMPDHVCDVLRQRGIKFSCHQNIETIMHKIDILYVTRLQKERLLNESFHWQDNAWQVTVKHLDRARQNLKILHPLPRVDEIEEQVDKTPYAYYFTQAKNALYVRQALLGMILNQEIDDA